MKLKGQKDIRTVRTVRKLNLEETTVMYRCTGTELVSGTVQSIKLRTYIIINHVLRTYVRVGSNTINLGSSTVQYGTGKYRYSFQIHR